MTGADHPHKRLIFISYRRADADAMAGRIRDRLTTALSDWEVFMDVASLVPGADFRRVIHEALLRAEVMVVVIGERWLADDRLHVAEDLVRQEIAEALRRNIRLIPVLINATAMPPQQDLPEEIHALSAHHAIELRHTRFDDDFANLVAAFRPSGCAQPQPTMTRLPLVKHMLAGMLLGCAAAVAVLALHLSLTGRPIADRIGDDGATLLLPMAGLLGSWFAYRRRLRRLSVKIGRDMLAR